VAVVAGWFRGTIVVAVVTGGGVDSICAPIFIFFERLGCWGVL
jgi:hypothetical protein